VRWPGPTASQVPDDPEAVAQALIGLHDIVAPEVVSWAPQTAGWYVLAGIVLVATAYAAHRLRVRRAAYRYRAEALAELDEIARDTEVATHRSESLRRIPPLLKRVELSVTRREDAAALTGDAWLDFLDGAYESSGFREGPGRILPVLAYGAPRTVEAVTEREITALLDLTRHWLESHDPARMGGD